MATTPLDRASWWPAATEREQIATRVHAAAAELTTAAMARIAEQHPWFSELEPEHRSWITVVARSGIDGFVRWFAAGGRQVHPAAIFDAAPRALTRRITLHQTVGLVRTTINTVEEQIAQFPEADRPSLQLGIVHYSREVAFGAAEVYARAAEARGAWDARLEALVVDAVIRGEADEAVLSRASTLGWSSPAGIAVVIGTAAADSGQDVEAIRIATARHGIDVLAAQQGERLVVLLGGDLPEGEPLRKIVAEFCDHFGPGPVVIGPLASVLADTARSARAALSGLRAAHAWPDAPRPVAAAELLPERVLAGDGHARRQLATEVYQPLLDAGGDLIETLASFLDQGGSVEATARVRFVHPNTVRYRMRRIQEVTGYLATDPRDAYVLRLALSLGRLLA